MRFAHICRYVVETLWAIDPSKLAELVSVLAFRAAGHEFTPDEIRARIGEGGATSRASKNGAVAVIPIRGVIAHRMDAMENMSGGTSAETIGKAIAQVADDPNVGTILYDVDSPGGTVPGIQELAAQMFALRGQKKQIAHVNDLAASAAYWLASQADEIVSIPSGTVGHIGILTAHADISRALKQEGIDVTLISAGLYKLEGHPFLPLTDEAKVVLQARVDEAYAWFVRDVARGRGVTPAEVRKGYGEGRAVGAKEAKAIGLIDRIGTFEETMGRLMGRKPAGAMRAEIEELVLHDAMIRDVVEPVESVAAAETGEDDIRRRRLRLA